MVNDAVLHGLPHDYALADGDLSHAIGSVLSEAGHPINTEFGGHGIGSTMHQEPHISNTGRPGRGYKLRPGLLLALESWVMVDTAELVIDDDGWTLRSARRRSGWWTRPASTRPRSRSSFSPAVTR